MQEIFKEWHYVYKLILLLQKNIDVVRSNAKRKSKKRLFPELRYNDLYFPRAR